MQRLIQETPSMATYDENVVMEVKADECRLLAFRGDLITVNSVNTVVSGNRICLTQTAVSTPGTSGALSNCEVVAYSDSGSTEEGCKAACMGRTDCNALEISSVEVSAGNGLTCVYKKCIELQSSERLIFPGIKLFRRSIQPIYRPAPTQLDIRRDSFYTQLLPQLLPDSQQAFCKADTPKFHPLSAGDYEETNQRYRESCPSGYAEISSNRSCEEASLSVTGNWLYESV